MPFQLHPDETGQRPRNERNAQVDEDALGDLPHAYIDETPLEAEERRQNRDEEPGVDAVKEHLEDAVEGDETRRIFGVPLGKLVPDDDHGDAAGQADHDQADHVLGMVGKEDDGEDEHEHRADHPVLNEGKADHLFIPEDVPHLFVFHFGKRRVHHQDQPDGDRDIGGPDLEGIDEILGAREEVAGADADGHGGKDPDGKVAVEE